MTSTETSDTNKFKLSLNRSVSDRPKINRRTENDDPYGYQNGDDEGLSFLRRTLSEPVSPRKEFIPIRRCKTLNGDLPSPESIMSSRETTPLIENPPLVAPSALLPNRKKYKSLGTNGRK